MIDDLSGRFLPPHRNLRHRLVEPNCGAVEIGLPETVDWSEIVFCQMNVGRLEAFVVIRLVCFFDCLRLWAGIFPAHPLEGFRQLHAALLFDIRHCEDPGPRFLAWSCQYFDRLGLRIDFDPIDDFHYRQSLCSGLVLDLYFALGNFQL